MPPSRPALALRRALHPLYRRLEREVHPLRYLFAEITRRCNLNCLHCGSDCGREPISRELTADQWRDFFAYLAANFARPRPLVVITGGEPLCHPQLNRIVLSLANNRLAWGLVTNGWRLTPEALDSLLALGLTSITISLDGLAEAHDWLRGRQGSFERALAAITLAAQRRPTLFDVVTCVNPRNLAELPAVMALLRERGVRQWRLFLIFPKGRARENPALMMDDDQLRQLFAWIGRTRKSLQGEDFALDFSCEGYFPRKIDHAIRAEPYFCRAGICIGSVLADGSIGACPNLSPGLVQGNIRADDFKTVWNDRFQPFRDRSWMRQGPCAGCRAFSRCQGNSLHLWDHDQNRPVRCFARLFFEGPVGEKPPPA
jgi:radical SAM protein with 4Fe4S-binding SPASM domain